jgi:hypothetical protein
VPCYSKEEMTVILNTFTFEAPGFVDTSEKERDLYPTWSEQHVDVVLERWKGNMESILLFVRVLRVRRFLRGLTFIST